MDLHLDGNPNQQIFVGVIIEGKVALITPKHVMTLGKLNININRRVSGCFKTVQLKSELKKYKYL